LSHHGNHRGGASLYGKLADPAFDLGMTVRTEQHALHRFLVDGLDGQSQPVRTDSEPFGRWINVMKLKRAEEPVVAAKPAIASTLYATGSIGLAQVAISAVICLIATVATARLAANVYERSILRIGARVRLREALRTEG
jgi:hypothetical protein